MNSVKAIHWILALFVGGSGWTQLCVPESHDAILADGVNDSVNVKCCAPRGIQKVFVIVNVDGKRCHPRQVPKWFDRDSRQPFVGPERRPKPDIPGNQCAHKLISCFPSAKWRSIENCLVDVAERWFSVCRRDLVVLVRGLDGWGCQLSHFLGVIWGTNIWVTGLSVLCLANAILFVVRIARMVMPHKDATKNE